MAKRTAVVWPNGKAYFFHGDQYTRYDINADHADPGYPQPINSGWPGVFPSDIDAAVVWPNGKAYFFHADQYTRYDINTDHADPGYPQPINSGWPGVFPSDIDAAVVWPNGKAYFFHADQYTRYDINTDHADPGYPQPINSGWPGVFPSDIDAAVVWPNGKAYFFHADQYTRYDINTDHADDGYPQPINTGWAGLTAPTAPPTTGGTTPAGTHQIVRDSFISFSEPFERRVPWMYLDIKRLVTTAVGNLVEPASVAQGMPFVHKGDGGAATRDEIGAEWQMLKGQPDLAQKGFRACEPITNLRLTDASIDQIVLARFDANDRFLSQQFSGWASWPADAQLGAHSIAWAGANFPKAWTNFNRAVAARDWTTAAAESHLQETGNPGVKPRNEADARLFNNAAVVDASGLNPGTLFYPQQL